jgi:hypothetical protein
MAVSKMHQWLRQVDMMIQMERHVCRLSEQDVAAGCQGDGEHVPYLHTYRIQRFIQPEREPTHLVMSTPYGVITADLTEGWTIKVDHSEPSNRFMWGGRLRVTGSWGFYKVKGDHEQVFDALWEAFHTLRRLAVAEKILPKLPPRRQRTDDRDED